MCDTYILLANYVLLCHHDWRYVALVVVLCCPALSLSASVTISQMRTSKCTCLIFGVTIGLDPG